MSFLKYFILKNERKQHVWFTVVLQLTLPPAFFLYIDDLVVSQWYSILKKRCQEESNTHLKKLNHFWKYEFFYLYLYVKGKVLLSWLLIGVIFRFINFFLCSANKPQELAIVMVFNVLSSFKIKKEGLLIEWNNKWQYAYIIYSTQSLAFRSDMTKTEIYL